MEHTADPMRQAAEKYLDHYFRHFLKNFDLARSEFDAEAIHQFRVSIKRIRAVFKAINKSYPGHPMPDDLLNPLREMFKAGGTARDLQVQLDLIRGLEKAEGATFALMKDLFRQQIEDSADEFLFRSRYFGPDLLEQFPSGIRQGMASTEGQGSMQERISGWMESRMEKLRHNRFKASDPYRLHRFRTRYKELSYVAEMVYESGLPHTLDKATFQEMKTMGQQLGKWHDHYQLWHRSGEIFLSATDTHLLEESYHLKKLLTPLHNRLFEKMQDRLKDESHFSLNIL